MRSLRLIIMVAALVVLSNDVSARAGDFQVQTMDGKEVLLSSYFEPGKWTMVMLWTSYCVTCRKQYPMVSKFHNERKDKDVKVIGLSLDGPAVMERVRSYMAKQPMAFESAIVDIVKFSHAFKDITEEKFKGTPTYLMFDPSGVMVAHSSGPMKIELAEKFIAEYKP